MPLNRPNTLITSCEEMKEPSRLRGMECTCDSPGASPGSSVLSAVESQFVNSKAGVEVMVNKYGEK